jgi:hypothetical protein
MLLANITISKTNSKVTAVSPITAGLVGATVAVEFDRTWNGYSKVYVWQGNNRVITDTTASGVVPPEVVANQKSELKFGVYGIKDGEATPTIWANLGYVRPSATPTEDVSTDPSLPVWAQLKEQIDGLGDTVTDEKIAQAVEAYMAEHPLSSGSSATIGTAKLLANRWVGSGNLYSQIVTIDGVTSNSQVDLTPTEEQLVIWRSKEIAFTTKNSGGVVTVYAIGQKPENDYTVQVTITEVK